MNKEDHINKMTDEALNSLDGTTRASAKPYLLTRINARLSKMKESSWERAGRFIARPAIAFTGLCLVIGINAMIIAFDHSTPESTVTAEQQLTTDDFSTTVATLYDTENNEP